MTNKRSTPYSDAAAQHHRRVAAFAVEIGREIGLNGFELGLLQEAASLHEVPIALLQPDAQSRLLADVLGKPAPPATDGVVSDAVRSVLRDFQDDGPASEHSRVVEVLAMADALDQHMEFEQFTDSCADTLEESNAPHEVAISYLRKSSLKEVRRIVPTLPVYQAAAVKALCELARPDLELRDLERIAKTDPVLAGRLVEAANSALFSTRNRIGSLMQAISYIGLTFSKTLLLAAVSKPMFSHPRLRGSWRHVLDSAELAGKIASKTKLVAPEEAVLAGLMHDVGILPLSILNSDATARCSRLINHGCPQRVAEMVVYGVDHAQAGAAVLETWKFPPDLIRAVSAHHSPERCNHPLSAILYIAEFCAGEDEDLPSAMRLRVAAARLGLEVAEVMKIENSKQLTALFHA
jgi:putative nucleotidyltransferase with HDIG domain